MHLRLDLGAAWPLLRYLEVVPVAVAGLPLPDPPPPAALLPPTDILPRCSRQGWELAWQTQKAEGLEGPGGEAQSAWGPPTAASQASRHPHTPTLGCVGARGPALAARAARPPSAGKESRSLSPGRHVHSAWRLKPRLF